MPHRPQSPESQIDMPIYEYACGKCGTEFEREQRMSDPPVKTCPECRSRKVTKLISRSSFVLKGGGWYADGYTSANAAKDAAKDSAKGEGSSADTSSTAESTSSPDKSSKKDSTKKSAPKSASTGATSPASAA